MITQLSSATKNRKSACIPLPKGKSFISIKDSGIGIPREDLNLIWDRFYKTDLSRGKDKLGSGLGLAICREIINAHKQTIDVVSTVGVGSEFVFTLPKA
ncbi:MAG: sensor histidine kinase [Clostridium sp.]